MNCESKADKRLGEASKSDQPETTTEKDVIETKTISQAESKFDLSETSVAVIERGEERMNLGNLDRSDSKKRKRSPCPEKSSKRNKTSKLSGTNTAPFHSSRTAYKLFGIKASSMQLAERGESYFNNMILALGTEKLDVTTFCTILPYISVDNGAPKDEGPDQGEITLLCNDLIQKAKTVLAKKRDDVRIDGEEENDESKKLESIIEELDKHQAFTVM